MKKQTNIHSLVLGLALATVLLLLVPFVAMQFTDEVVWGAVDFIIMGALLFTTGLSFMLITRVRSSIVYRTAVGLALGTTLFLIWANLAVGLIGSGPNLGNLMYMGVVAAVVIGSILSRFSPGGLERAMYVTALALVLIIVIALFTNMDEYPGSSVIEIVGVNGLFATLFIISGWLFRYAAHQPSSEKSEGQSR